jgi:L,D-peptidoglycan transpeptidase YkuD (ErfK/YbiS/YcfS/YnhG family)
VFIHLAREGFSPTAGCVGLKRNALARLLERVGPRTWIHIR